MVSFGLFAIPPKTRQPMPTLSENKIKWFVGRSLLGGVKHPIGRWTKDVKDRHLRNSLSLLKRSG